MSKIAIDIALLPSEEMMDQAIEINKELLGKTTGTIILDKEKSLPHISLCMGCVEENDVPKIKKILEDIAKNFSTFNLVAEKINADVTPTGRKVSCLYFKSSEKVQQFHEIIMKSLWSYLSYHVERSMLFNPPEVEEVTFSWIKSYAKKYNNPSLFNPHITVGFGETDKFKFPVSFTASTLALCQLGNYCTCRRVLFSTTLKN